MSAALTNPPSVGYQKLPGMGIRKMGLVSVVRTSSRLWLGPDHLLRVDTTGFTEEYRRFYYADIQAITLWRTARRRHWNIGLATALAVFVAIALAIGGASGSATAGLVAGLITGVPVLVAMLFNTFRGPTCCAQIRTAVQTELLPSLNRLRPAQRVLARLQPLIDQAQGALPAESVAAQLAAVPTPSAAATPSAPEPARPPSLEKVSAYSGSWHRLLFTLLLVAAALTALDFLTRHVALVMVQGFLGAILAILALVAVVRQNTATLSTRMRHLTWWTLGYMAVSFVAGYIFFMVMSMDRSGAMIDQWEAMKRLAEISPFESPFLMGLEIFGLIGSLVLGGLGSLWRRDYQKPT